MRLVVTLLVRDEADVVAATVEHHLAAGAATVVVTDNGSVDGTVEVLEDYARAGVVDLLHEPGRDYAQAAWVTRMARRAATEHGADWVVHADADELWRPLDGTWDLAAALADLPAAVDRVRAQRVNHVPVRHRGPGPWTRAVCRRDAESLSDRGTRIGPKTCHRASPDVRVAQGNHAVEGLRGEVLDGLLEVVHVPVRSWEQYARKIANGGASYAASDLPPEVGWHWREDHARLLDGTLREAYERRLPDADDVGGRFTPSTLVRDRLEALLPGAVLPARLAEVLDR